MLARASILRDMNLTTIDKRLAVLSALAEGNSIRATERMTGVQKKTIARLLLDVGSACWDYQDQVMRNLTCRRVQVDEIWSFVYAKAKNVPKDKKGTFGFGDVWTFTAIDAETKLVPCWMIGRRDADCARAFIEDLSARLANRIQLTTDGHAMYVQAVEAGFGGDVDFAQLQKIYESPRENEFGTRLRCVSAARPALSRVTQTRPTSRRPLSRGTTGSFGSAFAAIRG